MKKNEVRIGNLVEYDNRIFEIETIAKEFPTLNTIEFGIGVVDWNNIKPIPLTEEWLKNFGFKIRGNGNSIDWYKGVNPVTNDWLFYITWVNGYGSPFYRNGFHRIKDVHQLQNLYFALTGEELENL